MNDQKKRELWLLTGSQHLYGDDTLQSVARNSTQIVAALDRSGAFSARIVGKQKMWIAGLIRVQKPRAHLHTQCNRELPLGNSRASRHWLATCT